MVKFDDVIESLGDFGPYQKKTYFLLCLPCMWAALMKLSWVFIAPSIPHRCALTNETSNDLLLEGFASHPLINSSIPWDEANNKWMQCRRFRNEGYTERCDGYVFDGSTYKSSIVITWSLLCDRIWMKAFALSLHMVGDMCGSLLCGYLSDRFGRKRLFMVAFSCQFVLGIVCSLTPDFYSFLVCRFLMGLTSTGILTVACVMGTVTQTFFTKGFFLTALLAYLIPDWRWFQAVSCLSGIYIFAYWRFLPESTRWLLTKGKREHALHHLRGIAKENGRQLPDSICKELLRPDSKEEGEEHELATGSFLDLFRYHNLRWRTLNTCFNWFVNSLVYYGLSWNTEVLSGDVYVNFILAGLVEYPAYLFMYLSLNKWGRRVPLCSCMLLAGLALMLMQLFKEVSGLSTVLYLIGKLGITGSYGIVYMYSTELFPTVVRNVAMGSASFSARVGAALSSYLIVLSAYWTMLPFVIFGSLSFVAGFLTLMLPETMNVKLPETIEDVEQQKRKSKPANRGTMRA